MQLICDCGCNTVIPPKAEVLTMSFDTRTANDGFLVRLWSGITHHYLLEHVITKQVKDLYGSKSSKQEINTSGQNISSGS